MTDTTRTPVLFVHHSIGRQLLDAGGLRHRVPHLALWDHDYNEIGLSDPEGVRLGTSFPVPGDNTDPSGLVALLEALHAGRLRHVPPHEILVLKSCFPNSDVSEADEPSLRQVYDALRERALDLPQRTMLVSSPPLVIESTSPAAARRAERLADWLGQTWSAPRLAFVDLFATLSHRRGPLRGTLKTTYRTGRPRDSHLNSAGARAGAAVIAAALRTFADS